MYFDGMNNAWMVSLVHIRTMVGLMLDGDWLEVAW